MKGIGFAFDAFGLGSEHDRSKMKWRMKVGIEWRPSMANRQRLVAGRTPSPSFTLYYLPLSSTTTPLGQNGGALATWTGCLATILGRPTTPWFPYKRVAKGSLLLHPTSS
jgi:hypothetical protein